MNFLRKRLNEWRHNGLMPIYWRIVFRPHLWDSLTILALATIAAALDMGVVALCAPLLDTATRPEMVVNHSGKTIGFLKTAFTWMGWSLEPGHLVLGLLVVVCILTVIYAIVVLWQQYVIGQIQEFVRRNMEVAILEKMLGADHEFISNRSRGSLLYDLSTPPRALERSIGFVGRLASAVMNAGMVIALMCYLSWPLTLGVGLASMLWVRTWRRFTNHRAAQYGREYYDIESQVNKLEVDSIDGLRVVKAFDLKSIMVNQVERLVKSRLGPALRLVLVSNTPWLMNTLLVSILIVVLGTLVFGFRWVGLTFSQLVVFFIALRRLSPALAGFNSAFSEMSRDRRSIETIDDLLYKTPQESQSFGEQSIQSIERLELDHVNFSYQSKPEHPVLRDLSLEMRRGSFTAIVGLTGSGKSTLTHLLIGLLHPSSGVMRINGIETTHLSLSQWRQRVGYVGQDVFLFNASIRDNISLWDTSISDEAVRKACHSAQLDPVVAELPKGLDTVIGDRGMRLSGGQCQRLALARALVRRPDVLLLDEATSALDNLTEKAVYETLIAHRADTMIIAIAHRLTTVQAADEILFLQGGVLAERGTHDQLLERRGLYANLHAGGFPVNSQELEGSAIHGA